MEIVDLPSGIHLGPCGCGGKQCPDAEKDEEALYMNRTSMGYSGDFSISGLALECGGLPPLLRSPQITKVVGNSQPIHGE